MILMLKANQIFLKCFYNNTITNVLILASGSEFFRAKCVIYFNIYGMKLNEVHFSSGTAIFIF